MENRPKINLSTQKEYDKCFGCGIANPIGLKLKFILNGETVKAEFTPSENLQGWPGYVHGGISAVVLDEAMGWVALFAGTNNVTAKMEVKYRKMMQIGEKYTVTGSITKRTSRLVETAASITGQDGEVYAEGEGLMYIVSQRDKNVR
jgi:acyl-coenzyme A thioesterase PaaI-like protein